MRHPWFHFDLNAISLHFFQCISGIFSSWLDINEEIIFSIWFSRSPNIFRIASVWIICSCCQHTAYFVLGSTSWAIFVAMALQPTHDVPLDIWFVLHFLLFQNTALRPWMVHEGSYWSHWMSANIWQVLYSDWRWLDTDFHKTNEFSGTPRTIFFDQMHWTIKMRNRHKWLNSVLLAFFKGILIKFQASFIRLFLIPIGKIRLQAMDIR